MTNDQQTLAIWVGGSVVVIIVAAVFLSGRGETLAQEHTTAQGLFEKYQTYYPEEGLPSKEASAAASRLRDHQDQELKEVESALVATVPDDYRRTDVNQAGSRLSADLATLKQRSQRQKVSIPQQLPFESGLDSDEAKRSLQLVQLYVYKTVLDVIMDSGVSRITTIKDGIGYSDQSGTYAVLPCEFTIDGNYESVVQVIDTLRGMHNKGFGIRDLRLTQGAQNVQAVFLVTVIVINDPTWNLIAVGGSAAGGTRGTATNSGAAPTTGRRSLRGAE